MITYKVWLHLERIEHDQEYISMDEEVLPLPAGEFEDLEEAQEFMENVSNMFYSPIKKV